MHRAREVRAQFFSVIKMFDEVTSLLGSPLNIRRSEECTQECRARASRVCSSLLLMSSGDPSKLLTQLNILITGKNQARDSRSQCMPNYTCLTFTPWLTTNCINSRAASIRQKCLINKRINRFTMRHVI
jgi:hypothetical protein